MKPTFYVWGRGRRFRTLEWTWERVVLRLSVGVTVWCFGLQLETPLRDGRWRLGLGFGPGLVEIVLYPKPTPIADSRDDEQEAA